MIIANTKHICIEQRQHNGKTYFSVFCTNYAGELVRFSKYHSKDTAFRMARLFLEYGIKNI